MEKNVLINIHWSRVNIKHDQNMHQKRGILPKSWFFFQISWYMHKQTRLGDALKPSVTCCHLYNNPNSLTQPAPAYFSSLPCASLSSALCTSVIENVFPFFKIFIFSLTWWGLQKWILKTLSLTH